MSLRVTKETSRAIGRSMLALLATERHLWLNRLGIQEKEKTFLLDAPIATSGLFGEAVDAVVNRFQHARTQGEAFRQYLPRRSGARMATAVERREGPAVIQLLPPDPEAECRLSCSPSAYSGFEAALSPTTPRDEGSEDRSSVSGAGLGHASLQHIRNTILILCLTPFRLQNCLNSTWH